MYICIPYKLVHPTLEYIYIYGLLIVQLSVRLCNWLFSCSIRQSLGIHTEHMYAYHTSLCIRPWKIHDTPAPAFKSLYGTYIYIYQHLCLHSRACMAHIYTYTNTCACILVYSRFCLAQLYRAQFPCLGNFTVHIIMGNRSMCAQENHQYIHFMIHLYRSDVWSLEYYKVL